MSAILPNQAVLTAPLLAEEYPEGSSSAPSPCQQIIQQNGAIRSSDGVADMGGRQVCPLDTSQETTETVDTRTTVQKGAISARVGLIIRKSGECFSLIGEVITCIGCCPCHCVLWMASRDDD